MAKVMWYDIRPADAVGLELPHPDVQGPYNENGDPCPWPWEPIQLVGAPFGQYHCKYCGAMVMAGIEHLDYGKPDGYGLSALDYDMMHYYKMIDPASIDRWATDGGACL